MLLAPTLTRNCGWYGPVTNSFATSKREIWLTIDDGPDPDNTPDVLDVLEQNGAKATFFVIGQRVRQWPELARQITAHGHQMQNHTYTHPALTFWATGPQRAAREIRRGSAAIFEEAGINPRFFRAPVGLANPFVHAAAERAGLNVLGWSASGLDGVHHCPKKVIHRILGQIHPGAIILLHENQLPAMKKGVRAQTLDCLLREVYALGYRVVIPTH